MSQLKLRSSKSRLWRRCLYEYKGLNQLHAVYQSALRFITGCKPLPHHCTLYSLVNWTSSTTCRHFHWNNFILKSILGLLPSYLSTFTSHKHCSHSLRSQDFLTLNVPSFRTELGKNTFSYATPSAWNSLQQDLKLTNFQVQQTHGNSTNIFLCS